jgi:hypothetical protein
MADIKNQLVKDTYNYVLQSDLSTGYVYRIGGDVPVNPIFSSGLTILNNFKFSNGTEQNGYVLYSDGVGNAYWGVPPSGSGGTVSGDYLPLSGGTVTGNTIFTSGLTATTISATTYLNLPTDIRVTGGTYSNGTTTFTNNTGGTFTVTGFTTPFTGGTVTGATNFTGGVSATTISATTYLNLPSLTGDYLPLSGGTVFGNTYFTSGLSANTLYVSGLTQTSGITSTGGITFKQVTISSSYTATTSDYMIDVTGGTFSVVLPSSVGIKGRLLVIKNNGGGAVTVQPVLGQTIDGKPYVILGETNTIQLASNGSEWIALSYNISTVNSSTGVFSFTGLSIASTTTFNVAPVKGWIVDDTTNPLSPQLYYVSYSGGAHTAIYVNTSTETWVYLTSGGTVSQSNIELTEQQRRQNIFLGKLGHANKINIINAFSQPDFVLSPLSQLRDMFTPINLINGGIYASANGPNLNFNTSAGYLYGLGINFASSTLNPNSLYVTGTSPCTFQYRTQTGGTASNTTFIDPLNYDVGGVITPITGTKASNQRIYLVQNGIFRVQYAQETYNTLAAAIAGLATEQYNTFSNFTNNGILIGVLSVLTTATDLSDTSKARFFFASKFGETVGSAGGVATTTLQQAYNNSSEPEITINSTLDGLSIKNGTGNPDNTSQLLQGVNSSGVVTSFIRSDGLISGSSLSTPGVTASTNGLTATTISATTYQNLPTDIRVTGGTYSNGTATFTNNTGGTFSVSGFLTGATFDGGTVTGDTIFTNNVTATTISATTILADNIQRTLYRLPSSVACPVSTTTTAFTLNIPRTSVFSGQTLKVEGIFAGQQPTAANKTITCIWGTNSANPQNANVVTTSNASSFGFLARITQTGVYYGRQSIYTASNQSTSTAADVGGNITVRIEVNPSTSAATIEHIVVTIY